MQLILDETLGVIALRGRSRPNSRVRTDIGDDGEPLFCAADVARVLGYADPGRAVRTHCKGGVNRPTLTKGGKQLLNFIPEADLYRLVMRSKLPEAEAFERWIVEEVIPSIRKTGGYSMGNSLARRDAELALREREAKIEIELRRIGLKERELSLREKRETRLRNMREGVALRNSAKVRFKMGRISREAYEAQFLTSWDIEAGVSPRTWCAEEPEGEDERLYFPEEIADELGIPVQKVLETVDKICEEL